MSGNADVVCACIEAWNRDDVEAVVSLLHPAFVLEAVQPAGVFHGPDGFLRFREELLAAWDEFRISAEKTLESGERVLAYVHVSGRGKGSGIEIDLHAAHLYTVREGKIGAIKVFHDRDEALEASGLHG